MSDKYQYHVPVPKISFWFDEEGLKHWKGPFLFWQKLTRDFGSAGDKWSAHLGGFRPTIRFKSQMEANSFSVYLSLFK